MQFTNYAFADFATFKYGKMPNKKKVTENGKYPVFSGYRYVGYYDEYNTEKGQLIIVARGVGGTGDVKITSEKCYLTNLSISADINRNISLPEYLYYYFTIRNLRYLDSGSAQSQITISDLEKVVIPLPDIDTQKIIVSYLGAIDRKIKNNDDINNNLQQQAQTIFAEMFCSEDSDSWSKGVLSDIAEITMGQSPSGNTYNENGEGTVFFQGRAEFGFRFPTIRLFTSEPKRMARKNDTLMSVRAPVGDLNIAHEDCCIGRGLAAIHSKDFHQSYVHYTMLSLQKELNVFNGEGTVFGSINRNSLNAMSIKQPPIELVDKFEKLVAPIDALILTNHDEICHLQSIRDALIPKLMSGELDLAEIDI